MYTPHPCEQPLATKHVGGFWLEAARKAANERLHLEINRPGGPDDFDSAFTDGFGCLVQFAHALDTPDAHENETRWDTPERMSREISVTMHTITFHLARLHQMIDQFDKVLDAAKVNAPPKTHNVAAWAGTVQKPPAEKRKRARPKLAESPPLDAVLKRAGASDARTHLSDDTK